MKCVVNIACAIRWRVISVGIILYWVLITLYGKNISGAGQARWAVLIQSYESEESRHVAFMILFVKSIEQTSLTCIFGLKEL